MKKVTVNASKKYNILIGNDILKDCGTQLSELFNNCKAVIVTDDIVNSLYSKTVEESLSNNGFEVVKYVFPNGEKSKNITTFTNILEFLAKEQITRSDIIIALGGGVVGDVAGFCASSYLRGINYVQIPTTLLAQIDSSVGGKTAINLDAGKNLAGAFWQPSLVICDYKTLDTLSDDIFSDGIAEAIKYSFLSSENLYKLLCSDNVKDNIEEIITECVTIKRDVVAKDEFDTGTRQLLNFGHTVGHCVEKLSNFKITHGKGVAIGMNIVVKSSYKSGISDTDLSNKLIDVLNKYNLPFECNYTANQLFNVAVNDKKRKGNTINLIVPKKLAKCEIHSIKINELEEFINLGL